MQSGLRADSRELDAGLEHTNHEMVTCAGVEDLTNWATQAPPRLQDFFWEIMGIEEGTCWDEFWVL